MQQALREKEQLSAKYNKTEEGLHREKTEKEKLQLKC